MLEEFKKFALRGNVVDLAVAVIIGVALSALQRTWSRTSSCRSLAQ